MINLEERNCNLCDNLWICMAEDKFPCEEIEKQVDKLCYQYDCIKLFMQQNE